MVAPAEIEAILPAVGLKVVSEKRLGNDSGTQLKVSNGDVINCYDKGTWQVQGRTQAETSAQLEAALGEAGVGATSLTTRDVFVVYGHDSVARDQLEAMLRRWELEPLLLDQLPSEGQTIIEKLEKYQGRACFGVVLATPDDVGFRVDHEDEATPRARQNVVLELGMLLAKLGRERVAILIKDPSSMERPSDIQGLIYIPFQDKVSDSAMLLAKEMSARGIPIDLNKL